MKKGRGVPIDIDNFTCAVDGWERAYEFGVTRSPVMRSIVNMYGGYGEWDRLEIFATIRHHWTSRKTRLRTGEQVVLSLRPADWKQEEWTKEPETLGYVHYENGRLMGSATVPPEAYYSLLPCLVAGTFKELTVHVQNMRYRRGDLDGFALNPKETPPEDLIQ